MLITNFGTIPSQGGLMLPGWNYGLEITIPANSIEADLTNFPCTVIFNPSNFDFNKAKDDGSDIRFTDKLFNHYKFEKIEYSKANQFGKFTVLVPSVSDLTDTVYYSWVGNANAYNASIEAWQDMTGKQIAYNGNVKLVPNVAKFGKAAYFDGTGDLIDIPDSDDFTLGSGDFTFDFWIKRNTTTDECIFGQTDTSNTVASTSIITRVESNKLRTYIGNGSSYVTATLSNTLLDTNLHHIAIVRNGNTLTQYIDGIADGTANVTGITINNSSNKFTIGRQGEYNSSYYKGYIDEVRVSKGIARWTTNFTPPTEPYTVDAYTKLLMHFDTAPFTDETGKIVTTYGDVKPIKTAYADGARGAYFDGSGDYFVVGQISDCNFLHNGTPWTLEFNYKANSFATIQALVDTMNGVWTQRGIYIHLGTDRSFTVYISTGVSGQYVVAYGSGAGVYPNDLFDHHIEISFDYSLASNNIKIFVDGSLVAQGNKYGSTPVSTNCYSPLVIGAYGNGTGGYSINGNLIGTRATMGRVRHVTNFTPPSKFEIDSSDVVFCTNFDTIYSQDYAMVQHMGDSLVDATGNGNNGTATGTTVVSTEYGKVRQFDGIDDKITTALFTNTDNVTLTVMATKVGTGGTDLLFYVGTSGTNGYGLYTNSLKFSLKASATFADTTVNNTTTPQVVTLTRTSGTWTAIIDGISYAITNLSVTTPTGLTYFGGSTTDYYDGQLSNVRYSTVARSAAYTKAEQKAFKNTLLTITNV